MKINRNREKHELFLIQKKYKNEILVRFDIKNKKFIYSSTIQEIRFENVELCNHYFDHKRLIII